MKENIVLKEQKVYSNPNDFRISIFYLEDEGKETYYAIYHDDDSREMDKWLTKSELRDLITELIKDNWKLIASKDIYEKFTSYDDVLLYMYDHYEDFMKG